MADREHFQYPKNNNYKGLYVSDPIVDRITGIATILFIKRVNSPDNAFLGTIAVAIGLSYFQNIYESIKSLEDIGFLLLRKNGTIILRYPHRDHCYGAKFPLGAPWYKVVSQGGGSYRSPGYFDGESRLVAAQPLRDYPLVVNVAISENRALAHWHILALVIGLGTLLVSLGSALLIRALSQQFRRLAASEAAFVEKSKDLERANETIDIALNNMPQGLIMFDADRRFVICNERYARMYDLPPELMTPGRAVEDILQYRVATKTFSGDPDQYLARILQTIADGKTSTKEFQTGDGRSISVISRPVGSGGWVTTHFDVTERNRVNAEIAQVN